MRVNDVLSLDNRYQFKGQSVAWGKIGHGPPLVLVHGTPFSSQVWRKIAPWIADQRSVYYFDLVGYGASEKRAGQDVSLGVQNLLLCQLLDHWQLSQPEVVAHDFGGATALRGHVLNGLQYSRLTLIDPVALSPWGSPFVQHVKNHELAFSDLPANAHKALLSAYLQGASHLGLSFEALEIYSKPWLGTEGQAAFYRQIAQMDQKYTDEIDLKRAQLPFPVQLLWGEQDDWIPYTTGEKLSKLLTEGKLIKVSNAGHLVQDDAPEAIVAAILRFEKG